MSKLILSENDVSPETPASGTVAVYARDDSSLYYKASDGVEHQLGGGGGGGLTAPVLINQGGTGQTTRQAAIDSLTAVANPGVVAGWVLSKNQAGNAVFAVPTVDGVSKGSGPVTAPDYTGTEDYVDLLASHQIGAFVSASKSEGTYTDPDTAVQSPFQGGTVITDPFTTEAGVVSPLGKIVVTQDLKNILNIGQTQATQTYNKFERLFSSTVRSGLQIEQTNTNTTTKQSYDLVEDLGVILSHAIQNNNTTESKATITGPSGLGLLVEGSYNDGVLEGSTTVVGSVAQGNTSPQTIVVKIDRDLTVAADSAWAASFGNSKAYLNIEPDGAGGYKSLLKGDSVVVRNGGVDATLGGSLKTLAARSTTVLPNGTAAVDVTNSLAPFGAGFLKLGRTLRMKAVVVRGTNQPAFQLQVVCAGANPLLTFNLPSTNAQAENVVFLDVTVQVHSDNANFLLDASATAVVDGTGSAVLTSTQVSNLPTAGIKLVAAHNPADEQVTMVLASYFVDYIG